MNKLTIPKPARRLVEQAEQVLPLVERIITQTRRRVLEGKKMAAGEKVLSLFEPHTRAIPRHKGGALVEFGRQVMLDEVEGGIVTRYAILEHRGADCEFEARLWLAQEQVSRDGRDGTVAGFGSHCLQPAPYRPGHRGINPNERQRSATAPKLSNSVRNT